MSLDRLRLRVQLPSHALLDREVDKVIAESVHGSFCLEPRHIDYVAPIVPGILSFESDGEETFLGIGEGILVKVGTEVLVSVRDAVGAGSDDGDGLALGQLRHAVRARSRRRAEHEKDARQVVDRLEATLVEKLLDLGVDNGS